jgi:hypothetical protein
MIGRVGTVEQLGRSVRSRRIRRDSWLYLQVVGTSNDGFSLKKNSACENPGGFFQIGGIHVLRANLLIFIS